jgi:hypothetical protein
MSAKHKDLIDRLRKRAKCVYLATERSVADDLSSILKEAANALEAKEETNGPSMDG